MAKRHKTAPLRDIDYYLAEWLASGKRNSPHTARAYRGDVAQFIECTNKPFDAVTVLDIDDYRKWLNRQYEEPKTRARKLASVCSFYRFLNNQEVTALNLKRVERSRIDHAVNHDDLLTPAEIEALIAAVDADPVHHALLRLLYLTGCRIGEALALRWRDLTQMNDGASAHIIGKGKKARKAFIPSELWADLQAIRGESGRNEALFPFTYSWAWKIVKKAGKAVGIDVHPHQFRHAFASHLLAQSDVAPVDVQQALGHRSLATTAVYAHATGTTGLARRLKMK